MSRFVRFEPFTPGTCVRPSLIGCPLPSVGHFRTRAEACGKQCGITVDSRFGQWSRSLGLPPIGPPGPCPFFTEPIGVVAGDCSEAHFSRCQDQVDSTSAVSRWSALRLGGSRQYEAQQPLSLLNLATAISDLWADCSSPCANQVACGGRDLALTSTKCRRVAPRLGPAVNPSGGVGASGPGRLSVPQTSVGSARASERRPGGRSNRS